MARSRWVALATVFCLLAVSAGCGGADEGALDDSEVESTPTLEEALVGCSTAPEGPDGNGDSIPCVAGGGGVLQADFNGDNFSDLAIGAPYEDVDGVVDAGAVYVFFGSADMAAHAPQVIVQGRDGVADTPEPNDRFGSTLAALELACRGKPDLLIGVPYEDVGSAVDAGAMHLVFGTFGGKMVATPPPEAQPVNFWTQDTGSVLDRVEAGDLFGYSFTWALRMGTATSGLSNSVAVGAPGEDVSAVVGGAKQTVKDAGAVHVLHQNCNPSDPPTARGLSDAANQFWNQASAGIADDPEEGDGFGTSLTVGAFQYKGGGLSSQFNPASLVIGVPGEDLAGVVDAGAVHVLPPDVRGVTGSGSQFWTQDTPDVSDEAEAGDRFGETLLSFDANKDAYPDLVIGVPHEDLPLKTGAIVDAGRIHVLLATPLPVGSPEGSPSTGLGTTGQRVFSQSSLAGGDAPGNGDRFGASLATLPANQDIVAIGAPFEDLDNGVDAGIVHLVRGTSSAGGLDGTTGRILKRSDTPGETVTAGDLFGFSLSAWHFFTGSGGPTDLAVGVPGADLVVNAQTVEDAGAVLVYKKVSDATTVAAFKVLTQAIPGVGDQPEAGDRFGMSMY